MSKVFLSNLLTPVELERDILKDVSGGWCSCLDLLQSTYSNNQIIQ
jgi:hypothetical protein